MTETTTSVVAPKVLSFGTWRQPETVTVAGRHINSRNETLELPGGRVLIRHLVPFSIVDVRGLLRVDFVMRTGVEFSEYWLESHD